jgi:hypothetical protein
MNANMDIRSPDDPPVSTRIKLASLWCSVTLCYIYCDYFELYQPGKLAAMLDGKFGPLGPTTQGVLLGASILLLVPSLMIFLTTVLPVRACRALNILLGLFYSLIMLAVLPGAWLFYKLFAIIEILLTLYAAWLAWHWPAQPIAKT